MVKYRRNTTEVEAILYKGFYSLSRIEDFVGADDYFSKLLYKPQCESIIFPITMGGAELKKGDYLIKETSDLIGVYFHSCNPLFFESTYDKDE